MVNFKHYYLTCLVFFQIRSSSIVKTLSNFKLDDVLSEILNNIDLYIRLYFTPFHTGHERYHRTTTR